MHGARESLNAQTVCVEVGLFDSLIARATECI